MGGQFGQNGQKPRENKTIKPIFQVVGNHIPPHAH